MALGLPLALVTGWFVAPSLNLQTPPSQRPQSRVNAHKRLTKTKGFSAYKPEQKLERQALSHPRDWRWRVFLTQSKLQRGDRDGAERELITLQALWPNRPEVENLQLLMDVGTQREASTLKQTHDRFKQMVKGQRLALGLRLADLQRISGEDNAAIATYLLLAAESPDNIQPLLALALLYRDKGQDRQAQEVLLSLRNRLSVREEDKKALDQLAVRWQLDSFRQGQGKTAEQREPPPSAPKAQAGTTRNP